MSEPDSGSDLASLRTRAEPVGDGFRVNGTKIWTSGAHRNHYCIALVRTSGQHGDRHKGLSQILVDLKTPGVTIRPVINLAGRHEWNEVTFTDAFIPKDCLIGNEGDGWKQVTSELAFERAGPERFLQNFHVLGELVRVLGRHPSKRVAAILGRLVARLWTLRQMAVALAGMLQDGKSPVIEAALVKDLGTIYQQDLPEIARVLAESDATDEDLLADFLDIAQYSTMIAPSFTIQGGTTQVLRGMVARGLGLR
jgi:alkylation response protein AidB-like acyl-CoA dehydrogenase